MLQLHFEMIIPAAIRRGVFFDLKSQGRTERSTGEETASMPGQRCRCKFDRRTGNRE